MSVVVPLKEKREILRNSATMTVALTDADQITREYTGRNSSIDGAFLKRNESSTQLPGVGSRVQLRISWPNVTYLDPVDISAEVIHAADDGVGISFHTR
jgi:hypothetical protein